MDSFVKNKLNEWRLPELTEKFAEEEIDERAFNCLDRDIIRELIPKLGKRAIFFKCYNEYREQQTSETSPININSNLCKRFKADNSGIQHYEPEEYYETEVPPSLLTTDKTSSYNFNQDLKNPLDLDQHDEVDETYEDTEILEEYIDEQYDDGTNEKEMFEPTKCIAIQINSESPYVKMKLKRGPASKLAKLLSLNSLTHNIHLQDRLDDPQKAEVVKMICTYVMSKRRGEMKSEDFKFWTKAYELLFPDELGSEIYREEVETGRKAMRGKLYNCYMHKRNNFVPDRKMMAIDLDKFEPKNLAKNKSQELNEILEKFIDTRDLVTYNGDLQDSDRRNMVRNMIDYLMARNRGKISVSEFRYWKEAICERFPLEDGDKYFRKGSRGIPCGKLYDRYYHTRRTPKKVKSSIKEDIGFKNDIDKMKTEYISADIM